MRALFVLLLSSVVFAQPRVWQETTDPSAPPATQQILFASPNHGLCTLDSNSVKTCPVVASGVNAAKADTLTTARTINGVSFDGSGNITVTAAASTLSGTTLASGVVTSSLTTVGTIGTGVWQGTAITGTYGGTGVNNGSSTITIGGNVIFSGAFVTTITVTGTTGVTLPTSGTLVNSAVTTLSSLASIGTITTGVWTGTTIAVANGGSGITSAPAKLVYIPVAGCNNATAGASIDLPTANAPTPTCHGTTTTTGTLDFANSADQKATFEIVLPAGWTGNEDITLDWYTSSTSVSGKWTLETVCKAADGDMVSSPTYNSAQTITTTSSSTANGLTRSTQSAVTTTGCSAGNIQIIRVGRDTTDTSTATHSLLGIELTIRVTPQT